MKLTHPEDPSTIRDSLGVLGAINDARAQSGQAPIPVPDVPEAATVEALSKRVTDLEARLAETEGNAPVPDEDKEAA